jgi:hypothetical protein
MSENLSDVEMNILGEIYSSSESMKNLTILCDEYGGRLVGTPENRASAEFMLSRFEEYGFEDPHLESFKTPASKVVSSSLEIVKPKQKIPSLTLPMTSNGETQAEVIFLDEGAEVKEEEINGKIIMANTRAPLKKGAELGAEGFIFMHPYPMMGPPTGHVPTLLPSVSISYERGNILKRFIQRRGSVKVNLSAECEIITTDSWNICGEIPGNGKSEEYILFGGHIDGHEIAQAAFDCGAPCTIATEIGRILNNFRDSMNRNVRIVLFSAEEFGCRGSQDYAKKHSTDMKDMRFTYQYDCNGGGKTQLVTLANWPELTPIYEKMAMDLNMHIPVEQRMGPGDSRAFHALGIPNGSTIDYREPGRLALLKTCRHTKYDTLDKIDIRSMREATTIGAISGLRMLNAEEWPSHRK